MFVLFIFCLLITIYYGPPFKHTKKQLLLNGIEISEHYWQVLGNTKSVSYSGILEGRSVGLKQNFFLNMTLRPRVPNNEEYETDT